MLFKKLLLAGLAVGAVALNAPAASASHVTAQCRFNSVTQSTVTGQDTWEGVAEGVAAGDPGEAISVRCVVKVGTSVRAATDWGSGSGVATTAGRVTFTATETEVVLLCAQYTSSHGAGEVCFATTTTQIPPQEVIDALNEVFKITDPATCDVLKNANGTYGPNGEIVIKPGTGGGGGDVYINGELWWDCPGYEPEV